MKRIYTSIINFCKTHSASLLFYMLTMLSIAAIMSVSMGELNIIGSNNIIIRCVRIVADAVIIMLPYWFLPKRLRWTALIPVFGVALWSLSSLCYYRFWGKPLELYSILLFQNFSETLLVSGIGLCKARDLIYPAVLTVSLVIYIAYRRAIIASPGFSIVARTWLSVITLLVFIFAQCLATRSIARWNDYEDVEDRIASVNKTRFTANFDAHKNIQLNGAVVHLAKSIIQFRYFINLKQELTDAQRDEIEAFRTTDSTPADSTFALLSANRNKNLILIVVESLNSEVIHAKANGREITPTLNALFDAHGSVSATNIQCQVRHGGSGDGQLLVNTGLHPISSIPISTYVYYGDDTDFPSIARALPGYSSVAIFGDDSTLWNQRGATSSMGFDSIIDKRTYPESVKRYGDDGNMLHYAFNYIKNLKQPFFAELFTVSMHTPFSIDGIPSHLVPDWIDADNTISAPKRKYLKVTAYFDRQLGEFITALKNAGIYENTVIAIVSDHSISLRTHDQGIGPMLFIAANTGISAKITRRVGQVDLYPTLLQLMGLDINGRDIWRGVGTSILDARLTSAYDVDNDRFTGTVAPALQNRQKEAFRISELIIRGNYFKRTVIKAK